MKVQLLSPDLNYMGVTIIENLENIKGLEFLEDFIYINYLK